MSHIFLVHLTIGQDRCCEPSTDRTLRAFGDKGEAESYMEDMKRQVSHNGGLEAAVYSIMAATWEKENVAPTWSDSDDWNSPAYNAYREASETHREARCAEVDRLRSVVGWKSVLSTYGEEVWALWLQEVAFGFEVVADPTEEPLAAE